MDNRMHICQKFACALLTVCVSNSALAKVGDRIIWFNAGVGGGTPGIARSINLNISPGNRLSYQIGIAHNETFQLLGGTAKESITSYGFLIGARADSYYFALAGFVGTGLVHGFRRGDEFISGGPGFLDPGEYSKEGFTTLGLVGNSQLFWRPISSIAIGVEFNTCLNYELVPYSMELFIQFNNEKY